MDSVRRSRWQFRMVDISCRMSTACCAACCFSLSSLAGPAGGIVHLEFLDEKRVISRDREVEYKMVSRRISRYGYELAKL